MGPHKATPLKIMIIVMNNNQVTRQGYQPDRWPR